MLFFVRYKKKKEKYLWCTTLNSHRQNVRVSQISRFKKKKKQQGSRAVVFNHDGRPDDSGTNELSEAKDQIVTGWNKFYSLFPTGTWTIGHRMYNGKTMPNIKKRERLG